MENNHRLWVPVLVALALLSAACNASPTPTPSLAPVTIPPLPSPTVRATSTPVISPTPVILLPTVPPAALATAVPPGGNCTNKYAFVSDVSIPDNSPLPPGQVFTKTWRVKNTGTCTWSDGYTLAYVRGQAMTALPSVPIPRTAPNAEVDISVLMTAPATPGTHQGYWAIKNPQGVALTPHLWVKILIQ